MERRTESSRSSPRAAVPWTIIRKCPCTILPRVREYWIVDPMKEIVFVYDMEHASSPSIYSFSDQIQSNIYEDLYIDLSDIGTAQEGR